MKAFSKIQTGVVLTALFIILAFSGCNNGQQQDQQANQAADTIKKEITLSPEAQNMLNSLPTPFEVTNLLEKSKAGYIFDITNPPASVDKYNTELSKSLNLGIYSADLCYSATYNRNDETNKFLSCTGKLANDLGISGIYDQAMMDKMKKYNNNKDSVVALLTKGLMQTSEFLTKNNRTKVAVMVAAGAFAEGLYLTCSLAEVAKDNSKLVAVIAGQKDNHLKLLTVVDAYNADSTMKPVLDEIQKLKSIWGNYTFETGKKMDSKKVMEISDIAEGVRNSFAK